jgi:hypothetical protein
VARFLAKSGQKGAPAAIQKAQAVAELVKAMEPWPFCKMNVWEKDLHWLLCDKYGEGITILSQSYTLRWAASCSYTPDTAVVFRSSPRIEFYECKGRKRADGMTKIKTAAKLFPQHHFFLCTRPDGKKGSWVFEKISA